MFLNLPCSQDGCNTAAAKFFSAVCPTVTAHCMPCSILRMCKTSGSLCCDMAIFSSFALEQ